MVTGCKQGLSSKQLIVIGTYLPLAATTPSGKGVYPKDNYWRVRRNCGTMEDFHVQADMINFQEKRYARDNLLKTKEKVTHMNRDVLLAKTKRNKDRIEMAFVTGYNSQYRDFEHILNKYWPILREDRVTYKNFAQQTQVCL